MGAWHVTFLKADNKPRRFRRYLEFGLKVEYEDMNEELLTAIRRVNIFLWAPK